MRIAMVTHQWPGARMGGIGTAMRETAGALAGAGHEVHVFTLTLPADVRANVPAGVRVHEVADLAGRVQAGMVAGPLAATVNAGGEGVYRLALATLLCEAVREAHRATPFDVVEAPEVEGLGLPLMLDAEFDVPVVTHLHCCTAIAYRAHEREMGEEQRLVTGLEFAAIHLADGLCAPSRSIVAATEDVIPLPSVPEVIPHPYACAAEAFVPPPAGGPMLFVGRIEKLKGVAVIARALNVALPRCAGARFRFVGPDTGSGPGGGSMRTHVGSLLSPAVAGRVDFAGELARGAVERELRACSFCVLPSQFESFSMACCEAMGAGRTAIVGRGTGAEELVGEAGVAVDPLAVEELAEAMVELWNYRGRREELSRKAHARIRDEFTPDAVARRRIPFYEGVRARFGGAGRRAKLETLPPAVVGAVLPALVRLTGALTGQATAATPGRRLLRIMEQVRQRSGRPAEVLLYGAGKHTARLLSERHVWESAGHRVVGLIDDHPRFAEAGIYLELPVRSLRAVEAEARTSAAVVLSTDTYQDQFWDQTQGLRERGVQVFRLY